MLAGVTGILDSVGDDWVRIRVSGFVIHVSVPASVVHDIGLVGEVVSLHTYLRIREEQVTLYGFVSSDDLDANWYRKSCSLPFSVIPAESSGSRFGKNFISSSL